MKMTKTKEKKESVATSAMDLFDAQVQKYLDAIKKAYFLDADFENEKFNLEIVKRRKFLKVVSNRCGSLSVHSFISLKDQGDFKFGDVLKAASWDAPAKNFSRGNIFSPSSITIRWTGAV